jgi:hypothetical protein
MFRAHHQSGGSRLRHPAVVAAGLAVSAALLGVATLGTTWAGAASAAARSAATATDPNLFASVSETGTLVAGRGRRPAGVHEP